LIGQLQVISLPDLSPVEQAQLLALVNTINQVRKIILNLTLKLEVEYYLQICK